MKLSFSTLGCPDWTLEQILQTAQWGYDSVSLRGIHGIVDTAEIPELHKANRFDTAAKLRDAGLDICCVGTSASFHTEDAMARFGKELAYSIDLCGDLRIPFLRVFGNNVTGDEQAVIARVAAGLRETCRMAAQQGVTVLLEVHGDFNTAQRLLPVAEQVQADNFGLIWDVAHSDRACGDDFLPFYRAIRPLIRHVHMKDHIRGGGLCPVGQGDIPLEAILRTLQADGYDGYYELEWEKKWHPQLAEPEAVFPAYVKWMKERF